MTISVLLGLSFNLSADKNFFNRQSTCLVFQLTELHFMSEVYEEVSVISIKMKLYKWVSTNNLTEV